MASQGSSANTNSPADEVGKHKVLNRPFIDNLTVNHLRLKTYLPLPGWGADEKIIKRPGWDAAESRKKFNRYNIYFRN